MFHNFQKRLIVTKSIKIKGITRIANACSGGINKLINGMAKIGSPKPNQFSHTVKKLTIPQLHKNRDQESLNLKSLVKAFSQIVSLIYKVYRVNVVYY